MIAKRIERHAILQPVLKVEAKKSHRNKLDFFHFIPALLKREMKQAVIQRALSSRFIRHKKIIYASHKGATAFMPSEFKAKNTFKYASHG